MKNIIWLSPSLAAGAIAGRAVAFFERQLPMSSRQGRGKYGPLPRRRVKNWPRQYRQAITTPPADHGGSLR
jgi:hypothetical protein